MKGRLVGVWLDEEQLQGVRKLDAAGIPFSDLVREAINRRYKQVAGSSRHHDVIAIMNRIHKECPDPPDLPLRDYDVHNRTEARRAILHKVQTKRP